MLLDGVNCSMQDADKLSEWAKGSRCNVNLINYNAVEEAGYRPVSAATGRAFMERLRSRGVNVHLRRSLGGEIEAACGQLRRRRGK